MKKEIKSPNSEKKITNSNQSPNSNTSPKISSPNKIENSKDSNSNLNLNNSKIKKNQIKEEEKNNIQNIENNLDNNNNDNNLDNNNIENNQEEEETIPQLTKNEILHYSHLIFLNNATFINKNDDYFLSQQNLYKMLKECEIIPTSLKLSEVDLIFKSISPKSLQINFDQFMKFLLKITQKLYPKEFSKDKKTVTNFFMNNFFSNFTFLLDNNQIQVDNLYKCQYKSIESLLSYQPDEKHIIIINKIIFTLNEIYIKYFNYEIENNIELARKSIKNLIFFCREFEILPYILNETQIVTYYNLVINYQPNIKLIDDEINIGMIFTLNNFILFLIHISLYSYAKHYDSNYGDNGNNSDISKFLIFLEKLECSKGMRNFTRKLSRPSANKLSLIPPKEVFIQLGEDNDSNFNYNNNKINSSIKKNNKSLNVNYNFGDFEENFIIKENSLINNNLPDLERTFLYFSRIGDKMNFSQMNLSSFSKFLKHCSLLYDVPLKDKKKYNQMSKELMSKSSSINQDLKNSKSSSIKNNNSINNDNNLNEEKMKYKKKLKQIVNSKDYLNNNDDNIDNKLGESDVNVIFSVLTGPRNYDNSKYYKKLLDKNSGICLNEWNSSSKRKDYQAINNFNSNNPKTIITSGKGEKENQLMKLNFKTFLMSLQLFSVKLYPNISSEDALNKLLLKNIIPNLINENYEVQVNNNISQSNLNELNSYENIALLYDKISKDDEIKLFLQKLSDIISFYYKFYFDEKTYNLYFDGYINFYKDFGIFPDLINLVQLKKIFSFLVDLKKNFKIDSSLSIEDLNLENKNFLTYSEFIYSLSLTALLFDYDDNFSSIDKLLYLVERMNQSNGVKKWQKEIGRTYTHSNDFVSFLINMKKKYPNFYKTNNNNESHSGNNQINLTDIYGSEDDENNVAKNGNEINE